MLRQLLQRCTFRKHPSLRKASASCPVDLAWRLRAVLLPLNGSELVLEAQMMTRPASRLRIVLALFAIYLPAQLIEHSRVFVIDVLQAIYDRNIGIASILLSFTECFLW
jgi:hypothetical protein